MSFKAYDEYKDSGVEWLGGIPVHWNVLRFKQILQERDGRSTDGSETLLSVSAYKGVYPRAESREEGEHLSRAESLVGYKFCNKDELVINIMLAWNRGLGFAKQNGIVSPAYSVFKIIEKSSSKFLDYLVRSNEYIRYYKAFSSGVIDSRLRLYPESFGRLYVGFPPMKEQTTIAAFLDHETARIDALIEEQQRLIALLKEKRQAVISHAVTKGLDPNMPMKDSGVEWLGDVPAHWEVCKLSHVTDSRCDGPFGSALKSSHYTDEGVRVIRLQNIKYGTFNNSDAAYIDEDYYKNSIDKSDVIENDILIAGLGDEKNLVGRACVAPVDIYPAMVKADCFRFRLKLEKTNPYFMALQLSSGAKADAGILATGSTRSRIPLSTMSSRKIAVPDLSEQRKIFSYIDDKNKKFDALINDSLWNIELLLERRSALISAAVTGKIDVRDWQPPKASQTAAETSA